jgi:glyoxylase-like metal-dependent hydrolase (beta-lactamase superfamily II)
VGAPAADGRRGPLSVGEGPQRDPGPAQAGPVACTVTDFAAGISAIDTEYVRPQLDASHLVVHGGRAAFVDTGTARSVPHLLAALERKGIAREAVAWVFLTHVHLDHAGGAGTLLAALPNARAVVHPRGAPHLVEPARLVAATRQVYGDAVFERLYGEVRPIPAERLVVALDGTELDLAGRRFRFVHAPGHALHHLIVHDPGARAVFSGDAFGVSYRALDVEGRPFVLPATTPTQFDPVQMAASFDRVLGCAPEAVFLTHYSRVGEVARIGADLHRDLEAYVAIALRHADDPDPAAITAALTEWHWARLDAHGHRGGHAERQAVLGDDIRLNADGLASWLGRRRG